MSVERSVVSGRAGTPSFARAGDVRTDTVYRAAAHPGHACWVTLWQDSAGTVRLSFVDTRRASNPLWQPVPLDYWEAMGYPDTYYTSLCNASKASVYELVVLASTDYGETWVESGRAANTHPWPYGAWVSLERGQAILRVECNDYTASCPGRKQQAAALISRDGGKSWQQRGVVMEGYATEPYRLKTLADGTLALLGNYWASYGRPDRELPTRSTKRPYVRQENTAALFFSTDEGASWSGPLPVLPGVLAWEPDFVELPCGDLLILNCTVQGGPQVRQRVRRVRGTFVPGPVSDIVSGQVPECLVYTTSGLIVGAVRGGTYTCSNDDGATWYEIAGLPACGYQPSVTELPDGRLICAWHGGGGDEPFGEKDLWIGVTSFRLTADLPAPTRLCIARQMDRRETQFLNAYVVSLTHGGEPLPGKTIRCKVTKREGHYASGPGTIESTAVTDAEGRARIDLTEAFAGETDIHLSYTVTARFDPDGGDRRFQPARSGEYNAYAVTPTKADLGWD